MIEVELLPDGTEYRFVLQQDPDPQEPYDDGQWPILRITNHGNGREAHGAFNKAAEPYLDAYTTIDVGDRMEVFERYLRIFHGTTQFHTYGPNQATDSTYIAFDTKAWHEAMGFLPNNVEALAKEDPLAEIRAWIEDDVWGYRLDKRYNPDKALAEHEGWDEQDSCWGFYGHKHAEDEARAILRGAVENHKVVHRYPEHEKIAPHQTEIDAILGFLEAPPQGYTLAQIFPRSEFHDPHMRSVPDSKHQQVVFEHFGIDYAKIQEERELMFKRLREEATQ